jgi:riboflavin synthase
MFTGIIERKSPIKAISTNSGNTRVALAVPWTDIRHGESIAVNGVCLTIAQINQQEIYFDVIPETLSKTNLGCLNPGDLVNLERSVRVGDRIDGHFVQGHVDGTAPIIEQCSVGGEWRIKAEAPAKLAKFLVPKGSICLDGVSLTIAAIRGRQFEVALIPTTLKITTLGDRPVGWPLNLEADIFSKTIVNWLENRRDWVEDQVK